MKQFIWRWGPVVVWVGVIFWLSSIPHLRISDQDIPDLLLRKTAHMAEYAVLTLLVYRGLMGDWRQWQWRSVIMAVLASWLYAMSDEAHQHFVNNRNGNPYDVLIDGVGVVLGGLFIAWWTWWNRTLRNAITNGSNQTKS